MEKDMVDFLIVIGVLSFGILGGIGLLIWYFKPVRDFVIRIARCGRKKKKNADVEQAAPKRSTIRVVTGPITSPGSPVGNGFYVKPPARRVFSAPTQDAPQSSTPASPKSTATSPREVKQFIYIVPKRSTYLEHQKLAQQLSNGSTKSSNLASVMSACSNKRQSI
ncbi:hypothetical protein WR25_21992 [Diploscapter pachys]|uniref:Uncharacterized protein n=1 Tax=Diploscapter pachys TaxID=2018661 RepID=A0A2A2L9H4_9BILA|nr:hypothetical protein WR25_21992 [Diploscapter pachys]